MRRDEAQSAAVARANFHMVFGHNSNVKIGQTSYHVQTEDRGTSHAVIDTMVYQGGRVLHRRANSYADLLPLDAQSEEKLKKRVDAQHNAVLQELRSGALKLTQSAAPGAAVKSSSDREAHAAHSDGDARASLALELLNAKTWLAGKRATLQVRVSQKETGAAVSGAGVTARIEGAAEPAQHSAATGLDGKAQLAFDMPRLTATDCALVIEASKGQAQARLQFQLRAKPKVPAGE
jgi:hypothetical protein